MNEIQNITNATVKITDLEGNTCYVSDTIYTQIPISELPVGEYMLSVETENGKHERKINIPNP